MKLIIKIILTILILIANIFVAALSYLSLLIGGASFIICVLSGLVLPGLLIPLIWSKKKKKAFLIWLIITLIYGIIVAVPYAIDAYEKSITIDTNPNIDVYDYLPFDSESKIVKIDSNFKLEGKLPIIDGAAAVFPVYSAFVNAVYPKTTELYDGVFEYNNTVGGYKLLGEKEIDIFFGAYPSKEQIQTAEDKGTKFAYTPIGSEAFVFFVHKDNPISNLTTEQIQGIYSGKYTNWKELGGDDEEIVAYQRNEGSGSQSMLKRFMGDTPIVEAPTEQVNDLMSGIIEQVSDYRSKPSSIGFSFRYYVEGIIQNPDIKVISIDGVVPTVENIQNGSYPITTSLYAVTYEGNDNENVQKFLDWILFEEGQYIIEETGYVPVN